MTALDQLKAYVTAASWTDYETSVEEYLGRAVIDWWEEPGDPEATRDPHQLAVTVGAIVDRWDAGKEHRPMRRQIIHCRRTFSGADWDLADVLALIDVAAEVRWVGSGEGMTHDLLVVGSEGRRYLFDVRKPDTAIWGPVVPWEEAP